MAGLVLRSGLDLLEIARLQTALERHGERFLQRIYTQYELELCRASVQSLAARFAAKEATAKALGTGIGAVGWQEIEIGRGANGEPTLTLYGKAAQLAASIGLQSWSVSLSHTQTTAAAMVVAVGLTTNSTDFR